MRFTTRRNCDDSSAVQDRRECERERLSTPCLSSPSAAAASAAAPSWKTLGLGSCGVPLRSEAAHGAGLPLESSGAFAAKDAATRSRRPISSSLLLHHGECLESLDSSRTLADCGPMAPSCLAASAAPPIRGGRGTFTPSGVPASAGSAGSAATSDALPPAARAAPSGAFPRRPSSPRPQALAGTGGGGCFGLTGSWSAPWELPAKVATFLRPSASQASASFKASLPEESQSFESAVPLPGRWPCWSSSLSSSLSCAAPVCSSQADTRLVAPLRVASHFGSSGLLQHLADAVATSHGHSCSSSPPATPSLSPSVATWNWPAMASSVASWSWPFGECLISRSSPLASKPAASNCWVSTPKSAQRLSNRASTDPAPGEGGSAGCEETVGIAEASLKPPIAADKSSSGQVRLRPRGSDCSPLASSREDSSWEKPTVVFAVATGLPPRILSSSSSRSRSRSSSIRSER
mmetsp:Transcript_44120/g.122165  ORF Transcript_44120/g.122165 Transcript_44120/m.122165 type:complete len:464 (-) Transcript_44120:898-2289(-)